MIRKKQRKKQIKKLLKKSKEKNDLLKRVDAMMTEPIPQRLRVEFLG